MYIRWWFRWAVIAILAIIILKTLGYCQCYDYLDYSKWFWFYWRDFIKHGYYNHSDCHIYYGHCGYYNNYDYHGCESDLDCIKETL